MDEQHVSHEHLPPDRIGPADADGADPADLTAAAEPFVTEALRWLPAGPDRAAEAAEPVAAQGRVLVADDNTDMREYLSRLLRSRYAVQAVGDGAAALAAARQSPPDLVVSDVMMPGLGGMELLGALRADSRTARVPVLLLSARAGQAAAVEGLAAGADDYLVKPFSAEELLARVGAHLQLGRARREAEARFTAMADLAPALIWVADPAGTRVFVNRGWQQFTGHSVDKLGEGWHAALHPQDRQRYLDVIAAATAAHEGWEVEFRLRRADGVYRWMLERAVPVGPTEGWVGSCTDINARYRESERQRLLARFGAGLESESGPAARMGRLARLVVDTRLADLCCVLRRDAVGRLRPEGIAAVDADVEAALAGVDLESSTVQEVVTTGRTRLLPDVPAVGTAEWQADLPADRVALYRRIAVRSALLVPLTARGRVLGVLALLRHGESPRYDDDDRVLVEEVVGRAALALDNALLLADERATAARLAVLQRATAELSAAATPAEVGAAAVAHLDRLLDDFSTVGVYEIDGSGTALLPLALQGIDDDARPRMASVPLNSPLVVAEAVREQRPLWVDDVEAPEWTVPHPGWADLLGGLGIRGVIALPLVAGGRAVGVLGVGFRAPLRQGAVERATLLALAEQCAQALDRARLYRTEHQGGRDAAAQPAAAAVAAAPAPPAGRPVPARRRGRPGGRRLVRRDRAGRAPRGDRGRRRRRAGCGGRLRDGAAAQRAGRRAAAGPRARRGPGTARPVRRPGARGARIHSGVPDARLDRGPGLLGARRAPATVAGGTGRGPPPRRRRGTARCSGCRIGRPTARAWRTSSPACRSSSTPTGWSSGAARSSTTAWAVWPTRWAATAAAPRPCWCPPCSTSSPTRAGPPTTSPSSPRG